MCTDAQVAKVEVLSTRIDWCIVFTEFMAREVSVVLVNIDKKLCFVQPIPIRRAEPEEQQLVKPGNLARVCHKGSNHPENTHPAVLQA